MILVTAAGGKTGRQVVSALRAHNEPVRALGRTEAIHELREDVSRQSQATCSIPWSWIVRSTGWMP